MLGEHPPFTRQDEGTLLKVTTPSLRALQLYSQADALIAQGNSAAAEELLKQAVTDDPEFASAHIHLAHAIRNQGRPKEEFLPAAETAFRLADRTTERERYFIRGSYYDFLGQSDKAVAAYEALVSIYPDHFWGINNLIAFYVDLGRYDEAARRAVHRADLRPKDFEAKFWAAWFLARFDRDPARARLYVHRTLELVSPDVMREFPSEVAWLELFPANERWLEGDAAGALALATRFAEKLESTPSLRQDGAVEQLGNVFLTLGKLRTAEEFFHRLSDPTFNLTGLSLLRGNQRELKRLSSALVAHSYDVPLIIGILLARSGLTDQAERVLVEKKGVSGSALLSGTLEAARGELAMARGQTAEAIHQLKESQKRTRVFGRAAFLLGLESLASALARQGDLEGAIRVLELGSKQRHVAFHWVSNGFLWTRNQFLLAQLHRKVGRAADAQRIEAELLNLLALADADHPILVELKRLQAASSESRYASARPIG
jgi:tetratricopeptide (TPR) repeat protein